MKYFILTFGCQMNESDSERIASFLENLGYRNASSVKEADLIVVNMCSVRQSAVDRIYGFKKKFSLFKKNKANLKTILTGCFSKRDFLKFKNFFDYILPIKFLRDWPKFLKEEKFYCFLDPNQQKESNYFKIKPLSKTSFSYLLPISFGCNNFCTYCIVPFTRGSLFCRDHLEIIKEAKEAIKKDFKEIWLLGQNVNDYQSPSNSRIKFPQLLKMINEIKGDFWLRFTSPHPQNFSQELIETMAKCEKVTPYLNLPVQSGDNEILKKMNRNYTVEEYKELIEKIRSAFRKWRMGLEKEIALSTDVIVGFPGEKRRHFNHTLKLFKEIGFDMAYIAKYSSRPGTAAEKLKDDVSFKEKERRYQLLNEILKKSALKNNQKFLGEEVMVLIEKKIGKYYLGKSRHYKTVKIESKKPNLIGQFVKVRIKKISPFGLLGEFV